MCVVSSSSRRAHEARPACTRCADVALMGCAPCSGPPKEEEDEEEDEAAAEDEEEAEADIVVGCCCRRRKQEARALPPSLREEGARARAFPRASAKDERA